MTDFITVTGTLGTDPDHKVVGDGLERTTFRLASSERRRGQGDSWEDVHTNWYTVTAFGRLATNLKASLVKGQRIIVTGKLRIRTFTREDNSTGTQIEILANSAGHDLSFQTATANRRPKTAATTGSFERYPGPVPGSGPGSSFATSTAAGLAHENPTPSWSAPFDDASERATGEPADVSLDEDEDVTTSSNSYLATAEEEASLPY